MSVRSTTLTVPSDAPETTSASHRGDGEGEAYFWLLRDEFRRDEEPRAVVRAFPRARRPQDARDGILHWDDLLLTAIIVTTAILDGCFAVFQFVDPAWYIQTMNGLNVSFVGDNTKRMQRVGAWGYLEGLVAGTLLVGYRALRWDRDRDFNGANFQFVFLVNMIGKSGAFFTNEILQDWRGFGTGDGALDRYFLLTRALLATLAFCLSLYTYKSSWVWLFASVNRTDR